MKTLLAVCATLFLVHSVQAGCSFCASSLPGVKTGVTPAAMSDAPEVSPPPPGHVLAPGPEFTGDYSIQYLYSRHTGRAYSDPMYYEAQGALSRWREARSGKAKPRTERPQSEK